MKESGLRSNFVNEPDTGSFRPSSEVVHNSIGDQAVLVNVRSNEIYELNHTGAYFWELLCQGHDLLGIKRLMLERFDVEENELESEIAAIAERLLKEKLIIRVSQ